MRRGAAVAATASLGLALLGIGAPPAAAAKAGSYVTAKIVNFGGTTYTGCEAARKRQSASIEASPTMWVISSPLCYRSKHVSSIGTITYGYSYGIVYGYR